MLRRSAILGLLALGAVVVTVDAPELAAAEEGWTELTADNEMAAWRKPTGRWQVAGGATVDPKNPKRLTAQPGSGTIVNGPTGRTNDIVTKEKYGDIEVHLEFVVPKGSNSGIKFEGLYEIQIADSWGVKEPTASHCGGIYPRAELLPRYHHIDKGIPPRVNAARPPGEWQAMEIVFQAPRFDAQGKKTASARFVRVVLNGTLVQDNVEVASPTGHAWTRKEHAAGPILLQGDHGPVAFRNVRVRPWNGK